MSSLLSRVPVALRLIVAIAVFTISGSDPAPGLAKPHTIELWSPIDGAALWGSQHFNAVLAGESLNEYRMYRRAEGGHLNGMANSQTDVPYEDSLVDLSQWPGEGSHEVNLIATNKGGQKLARRTVTTDVTQTTLTTTAAPTSTTTSPPTTTSAPPTTITAPPTTTNATTASASVLSGATLYVDPGSQAQTRADSYSIDRPNDAALLDKIAGMATAKWFGDWSGDIFAAVDRTTDTITAAGAIPVYVAYNIPLRDCSGYSAGGSRGAEEYRSWVRRFTEGIGTRSAAVILEPDAVALLHCLSDDLQTERLALLKDAIDTMGASGTISVYIDAGHARWHSPAETARRLKAAGIAGARGFSLNVSNFIGTEETVTYGEKVSLLLGGKPFVVDSSRNGLGPSPDGEWCNPSGRALGLPPTTKTDRSAVDAFLWVKPPGESDGTCNGGPSAGEFWTDYALDLAERADW